MNKRELLLKQINDEVSFWQVKLENLGSQNLLDVHNLSEDSLCELLNLVYDYKLKNLNTQKARFPAIDLGDEYNSICFQVTSDKSSGKVQDTLNKYSNHQLYEMFEELFIFVLGKKQRRYLNLTIPEDVDFNSDSSILDFQGLLRTIRPLSICKLERILWILRNENNRDHNKEKKPSSTSRLNRKLSIKKRLQQAFILKLDHKEREHSWYEPWIKFKYGQVLIRSVDDNKFPEADINPPNGTSSWLKFNFWDFYDNGIELIDGLGGDAIFDKEGYWDMLDHIDDTRENNNNYKVVGFRYYYRIPFEYIVNYDMETDPYYGLPSIYVKYAKNHAPYEEIRIGSGGVYKLKQHRWLFDEDMRKKLP